MWPLMVLTFLTALVLYSQSDILTVITTIRIGLLYYVSCFSLHFFFVFEPLRACFTTEQGTVKASVFVNRRHFELDKADCLLKDDLLRSAGSMCSSCHGFEETTPERWNTRNLKKGFILTSATEAWWENNSKEDIENTNDRLKGKLELHRYK